ncbi:MAG TPA: hypothetical protein VKD66_06100 [Streptosporangiaceae bacterium]|nr:hypothetical protein [Streptosporangiaceae bacterium]
MSAVACGWLAVTSRHPYDMLLCSTLLGVGIGLAFAALGNLIVQAVPAHQAGVASGMNTVLRTLGGHWEASSRRRSSPRARWTACRP